MTIHEAYKKLKLAGKKGYVLEETVRIGPDGCGVWRIAGKIDPTINQTLLVHAEGPTWDVVLREILDPAKPTLETPHRRYFRPA